VPANEAAIEAVREPHTLIDRAGAVFVVSLFVRVVLASIFLGGADTMNSLMEVPLAATHTFFYLPYFPIVQSIIGAVSPLVSHAHFVPLGLSVKLVPCIVDSLLSVWLLQNGRFDVRYRRRSAWLYAFCPLPLIMICLQGQWDSLWVLPAVTALALSDLLSDATKARRTTLLLIGGLLGLAVLSKPAALIIAGLLLPSFRSRTSVIGWMHDALLLLTGATVTVVIFFLEFAANGIHVHQNIYEALEYGGQPLRTLFGPANLAIFQHFATAPAGVAGEFRQLSIIYVVAIALYQLFARHPVDRMTAAAAAVLICPAIGGLAPDYLFWPLVFILASGRLRMASAYAVFSSSVFLLFFLIPGASYNPGVDLGALLPLRSLRFLGLPTAAFQWFSSPASLDVWHCVANFVVPLAMCALGVYLLASRAHDRSGSHTAVVQPLELRSIRTIAPYAVLMVLVVVGYGVVSIHDPTALVSSVTHGVNRYAFADPIFSWHRWSKIYFWTAKHPYRDILGGSWWGTILILGPLGIAIWGAFALRASRPSTLRRPDIVDDEPAR
jgi:hypothetical protein